MSETNLWGVMPAAGIGARMQTAQSQHASLPKQYLPLAGKTIIELSLERLLAVPSMKQVAVCLNPADEHWQHLSITASSQLLAVDGGRERCDSVLNGLEALSPFAGENDWVLVHDAARPCVTRQSIERLLQSLDGDSVGGILGVPVSDTLKSLPSATGKTNTETETVFSIDRTVDRSLLWQAHTPQLFRFGLLKQCLTEALENQFQVTDEASALEFCGYHPRLIEDRRDNLKITRPEDLALAEAILNYQKHEIETATPDTPL